MVGVIHYNIKQDCLVCMFKEPDKSIESSMCFCVADEVPANYIQVGITSFGPPLSCGGTDACAVCTAGLAPQHINNLAHAAS